MKMKYFFTGRLVMFLILGVVFIIISGFLYKPDEKLKHVQLNVQTDVDHQERSTKFCWSQQGTIAISDASHWVEDNFARNKVPPFSFVYGGRNSNNFITKWDYKVEPVESKDPNMNISVYSYSDPKSGLVVKSFVTTYNDFPVVEWVLKFINNSTRNTPVIEKVNAINHIFSYNKSGTFILHHAKGSTSERSDFRPYDDELKIGERIYMTPEGGRGSSYGNMAFPFFNIESPANEGIMVAVGWTGKWYADVQQKDEKSVSLKSGMERMQLYLFPQEEIRTLKICLLFWKGEDRMTGHNQFRRFVLAHHTQKINGKPAELPLSAFFSQEGPPPCNVFTCMTESYALATIDRFKQFNILPEVFWLDAGWYPCDGIWRNVGSWIVNKENFPNGLKPVSDAAHKAGAKFLLWFEPERVTKGSMLDKEHPEWLIELPMEPHLEKKISDWITESPFPNPNMKLLNLGNKDALKWLTNHISDMISNEGIDIYRQDFNFDPWPYWEKSDQQLRIGMSEIRYIEGLYAFWDSLLVRFPDLIIDNCASGGRRLDLETISRTSPLWRTDYQGFEYPNGCQDNTYGLNFYLPLHGTGNFFRNTYFFRSNLGSSLVLNWNINSVDHSQAEMQKYISDFKRLRPYYYGDYYPLTGIKNILKDNTWLAYQLNRPEKGDGIILAFRREGSLSDSLSINFKGLDKSSTYELFFEDYGIIINKTGTELMEGLKIYIPTRPGSLLITYEIKE